MRLSLITGGVPDVVEATVIEEDVPHISAVGTLDAIGALLTRPVIQQPQPIWTSVNVPVQLNAAGGQKYISVAVSGDISNVRVHEEATQCQGIPKSEFCAEVNVRG